MILIGQFDSPFVRRVGIALRLYGLDFEHQPWSTFGDGDRIAAFNPLRRVPTLVLEDGEVVIESGAILDHLDEIVGPERAMLPRSGPARRRALWIGALGSGLADKAVALFYERALHQQTSEVWAERCRSQILGVLERLEQDRATRASGYWFGPAIAHADVMVACALRFVTEVHPGVFDAGRWPALARHAERCESLPAFREIAQAFAPPS